MSDSKEWLTDEMFDLLIDQAIGKQIKKEMDYYENLPEEMSIQPSASFDAGLIATTEQYKKAERKQRRRKRALWVAAVLVLVIGTHFTLYSKVEAYRVNFQQLFLTSTKEDTRITVLPTSESNMNLIQPDENCPFELWIPAGFDLTGTDENNSVISMYYNWKNESGEKITFSANLHNKNETDIDTRNYWKLDTENGDVQEIFINRVPGYSITKKDYNGKMQYGIVWSNANYLIDIHGSIFKDNPDGYEIMLTIAESLQLLE